MQAILLPLAAILGAIFVYYLFFLPQVKALQKKINQLKTELSKKRYEALILTELEDRIGSSLDPVKIGEIIIGSLEKVIEYHTASYLLFPANSKLTFKCFVRESVNRAFVAKVKERMLASLATILNQDLSSHQIEENLSGAILDESVTAPIGSFFNIPLVIADQAVGVITVASPKQNIYTEEETNILYMMTNKASSVATRMQVILQREKSAQETRRLEAERRAYQAEVLRELSERIGYSLDVAKIIEIITGSLDRLLLYHTVSYMLKEENKIIFKCRLHRSVSRAFVKEVKEKMLAAFSAMLGGNQEASQIDESITGTIFDESNQRPMASFFNLPLIINNEVVGLINVASTTAGLYTEEETAVLYTITQQASTAVSKLAQVLENEKSKLTALVASLTDGLVMVDPSWNLLVVNPQARLLLSLSQGKITMLDVLSSLSGKIDLRTKIQQAMEKDTVITIDDVLIGRKTLQILAIPVKDKKGEWLGAVVAFHDVSRAKELEALRDQFEAMMIHELRSPLNNIRLAADNLSRDLAGLADEDKKQLLKVIRSETTDMLELVSDLLDVAKLEAGKFTISKRPTDLGQLAQDVLTRFQARAQEKQLTLEVKIKGDLANVSLDSFRIRQVMANLVGNAIKFTETGGILVEMQREEDLVKISVRDTGVGIAKEDLGKLFTKFYQLAQTTKKGEGTGLGLVIAQGIIKAHGGQIWAESEEGVGSTFSFTIPI